MIRLASLFLLSSLITMISSQAEDESASNVTVEGKSPIKFILKAELQVQVVNGKLNVAFTNQDDVIFQVTNLELKKTDNKRKYSSGLYRLILMNVSYSDGALVSPEEDDDGHVLLEETESNSWKLSGTGLVTQGQLTYRITFRTEIDSLPPSEFIQTK